MQLGTLLVLLFVGDLIPSPLAGFGTTLERIRKHRQGSAVSPRYNATGASSRGDRLES